MNSQIVRFSIISWALRMCKFDIVFVLARQDNLTSLKKICYLSVKMM